MARSASGSPGTFKRKLRMLQLLPEAPQVITVSELETKLLESEPQLEIHRRSIERDLEALSRDVPLCRSSGKPAGWNWAKGTKVVASHGMDTESAFIHQLLERFLGRLVPARLQAEMQPQFDKAREVLQRHSARHYARWNQSIVIDHEGPPLRPPEVDRRVLQQVNTALFERRQLRFAYLASGKTGADERKQHQMRPAGLVMRGPVPYLVAFPKDGDTAMTFALHRMSSAELLYDKARIPAKFNLEEHLNGTGSIGIAHGGTIQLELLADDWLTGFLAERPLSEDQTCNPEDDSYDTRIIANVADTGQLRWWLLSLGFHVEVVGPKDLREYMAGEAATMASYYE